MLPLSRVKSEAIRLPVFFRSSFNGVAMAGLAVAYMAAASRRMSEYDSMGSSYGANVHPGLNTIVQKNNTTSIKASQMRNPSRKVTYTSWGAYRAGWLGEGIEDLKGGTVQNGYLNMRWHGREKPRWPILFGDLHSTMTLVDRVMVGSDYSFDRDK